MNKENIQLVKNISAQDLSHLEIPCKSLGKTLKIHTEIHTQQGSLAHISEIVARFHLGKVFLLSGEGLEKFESAISLQIPNETITQKRIGKSVGLTEEFAHSIASTVSKDTKIIIATGGGVICDLSKIIACYLDLPLCFVPSAPTSDAMLSDFAVVGYGGSSRMMKAKAPDFVICDPLECVDVPARLVRAGFGDAVSNYLAVFDWMVAKDFFDRPFCVDVAMLAISSADKAVFAGEVYTKDKARGVELLFEALLLSSGAMALLEENTPCCGGEHAVAVGISKLDPHRMLMHGESVFVAFCKLVEIYELFFTNYSNGKYLPPDTASRCDFLISQFGASEEKAEKMCKPPASHDEYKIMKEKYRICKWRYLPNIRKLSKKLPQLKNTFFSIYSDDGENMNIESEIMEKSIGIAPDLQDKFTTLTLMREFGLLDNLLA